MRPVNFEELALSIVRSGGTSDYSEPLGKGKIDLHGQDVYSDAKLPEFPGDLVYANGPLILSEFGADLPQPLIDANHQSFRDALKHFMPPETVTQHQCAFFQTDLLESLVFKKILSENIRKIPTLDHAEQMKKWGRQPPPESLSFNFEHQSRKNLKRSYFTLPELAAVEKVVESKPEIYEAVFAFQAGFLDYVYRLKEGFEKNGQIDKTTKERALQVIDLLCSQWDTANFARELIPCMCLAYYQRDPSLESDATTEDFKSGYALAISLGVFQSQRTSPAGTKGERSFKCPAQVTIGTVMARDDQHLQGRPSDPGAMLGMICRLIKPSAGQQICPSFGHDKLA